MFPNFLNQIQDWNLNFREIIDSMHMLYQSYESGMKTHSAHLDEECRMEKVTLELGDMEGVGVPRRCTYGNLLGESHQENATHVPLRYVLVNG